MTAIGNKKQGHWVIRQCIYMTLLEMLVVLSLLASAVGVTAIHVNALLREARFSADHQKVVQHLAMAQDLMLILDADVTVHFQQVTNGSHLMCWTKVEKPLTRPMAALVERKIPLKSIASCSFSDIEGEREEDVISFSWGKMSRGIMTLIGHDAVHERAKIVLPGYPGPIGKSQASRIKEEEQGRSEQLYPVGIYHKLYDQSHTPSE